MGIDRSGGAVCAGFRGVKMPGESFKFLCENFSVARVHGKLYNHESVRSLYEWVRSIAVASRNSWGEAPKKTEKQQHLAVQLYRSGQRRDSGAGSGEWLRVLNAGGPLACVKIGA